jgi:predicted DNA-binding transcriptional regulator AlpA
MNRNDTKVKGVVPVRARVKTLSALTDIPESTIWTMVQQGRLPKPKKAGPRHTLFDMQAWIAALDGGES